MNIWESKPDQTVINASDESKQVIDADKHYPCEYCTTPVKECWSRKEGSYCQNTQNKINC
jgi:hypothetical protein